MADGWYGAETATLGDRIAGAREAAGLEPPDLAKRLGIKANTLRNWEEDLNEPRANKLQMLSGILGVSLSWLLTGEGEGIAEPETADADPDLQKMLAEMRDLRTGLESTGKRLAVLEKRLRKRLVELS